MSLGTIFEIKNGGERKALQFIGGTSHGKDNGKIQ